MLRYIFLVSRNFNCQKIFPGEQAGLLQEHIPLFHYLVARGKSNLDGYDIMAKNLNLHSEYEWGNPFLTLTVELC